MEIKVTRAAPLTPHSRRGPEPENEERGEHDVENDAQHLQSHGRLDDPRSAQRRAERDERELQRQSRDKPEQINLRQSCGRDVRAQRIAIRIAHEKRHHHEREPYEKRHHDRLIQRALRVRLILPTRGLRDQRGRSHAEHLRQRQHHHHQVSRHPDGRDCFPSEPPHPIKISQQIKRLHQHTHGHERRHMQQVPYNEPSVRSFIAQFSE